MPKANFLLILLLIFSCNKKTAEKTAVISENTAIPPYDTVAIDSFSAGATSVDIARQIRMSTVKFQDSLKQVKIKAEEEQLLKKAKEEKQMLEKAKTEKNAAEAAKKPKAEEPKPSATEEKAVKTD